MNNVTTEEVDRVLRLTAEPMRKHWGQTHNHGESLVGMADENKQLASKVKTLKKILIVIFGLTIVSMFALFYFDRAPITEHVLRQVTEIGYIIVLCIIVQVVDSRVKKAEAKITQNNEVFGRFIEDREKLNPLGTGNSYHDMIDVGYVLDRAETLAVRLLDAQDSFEAVRKLDDVDRFSVIHAGNWIETCEKKLDAFWVDAAENFGVVLDKATIFARAKKYLVCRKQPVPTK